MLKPFTSNVQRSNENFDSIHILSDYVIQPSEFSELGRLFINPRIHQKFTIVAPCWVEHWISTDLFKYRLSIERQGVHVIGACSINQIPQFSLFCDEIVLMPADPIWYQKVTANRINLRNITKHPCFVNIERCQQLNGVRGVRDDFAEEISDKEVIARFACKKIFILQSAYDKFMIIKQHLPTNIAIAEINWKPPIKFEAEWLVGVDQKFQKDLIERVGCDSYMSTQILGSHFLNWQFICEGGSANLMSTLPIKTISLLDHIFTTSTKNIIRGFAECRNLPTPLVSNAYRVDKRLARSSLDMRLPPSRVFYHTV